MRNMRHGAGQTWFCPLKLKLFRKPFFKVNFVLYKLYLNFNQIFINHLPVGLFIEYEKNITEAPARSLALHVNCSTKLSVCLTQTWQIHQIHKAWNVFKRNNSKRKRKKARLCNPLGLFMCISLYKCVHTEMAIVNFIFAAESTLLEKTLYCFY